MCVGYGRVCVCGAVCRVCGESESVWDGVVWEWERLKNKCHVELSGRGDERPVDGCVRKLCGT